MPQRLDFLTGKPSRRSERSWFPEYACLAGVLSIGLIPYAVVFAWKPWFALSLIGAIAAGKVLTSFFISTQTDTSHHIRFLLAGSNPIGMTGGASLLLAGVDAILDWREDRPYRLSHPLTYGAESISKVLLSPVGLLLLFAEFCWDVVLLRRGMRLVYFKWQEFFSVALYHDMVCPEKSNDIFYADLAFARYQNDPYLYQWNRMRAMIFELQHYRRDLQVDTGVASSNLLRQDPLTAYQTLKKLKIEEIEDAIADHDAAEPQRFPIPANLARKLVAAARPLQYYLRFRREWNSLVSSAGGAMSVPPPVIRDVLQLVSPAGKAFSKMDRDHAVDVPHYDVWHVLRLLDVEAELKTARISRYVTDEILRSLERVGILKVVSDDHCDARTGELAYRFHRTFIDQFEGLLSRYFRPTSDVLPGDSISPPIILTYRGVDYFAESTNARSQLIAEDTTTQ